MHAARDVDEGRRVPPALPRSLRLLAIGFVLVASSALVSGEVETVGWAAAVFGVVVLALTLPRFAFARSALRALVGLYAVGASVLVIASGVGNAVAGVGTRVVLFGENPNLVGAGIALAALAWAAVAPRRRWVWWVWPIAGLAVLLTGSRTAAAALAAGVVVWCVIQVVKAFPRARGLAIAGAVVLPSLAVAAWQLGVVERVPNLLVAPNDFANGAWNTYGGASVTVIPDAAPGPFEGTRAYRIVAQAGAAGLVFLQGMGQSEPGVPYVASVYLRADEPQTIGLGSHLAGVGCEVGLEWARCVTPVGFGNGVSMRQHRFSTDSSRSFDVYAYGAQYERGEEASPFVAREGWLPQTIVNRFDLRWMLGVGTGRGVLHEASLDLWRMAPWFGFGRLGVEPALAAALPDRSPAPRHAHNQLLQLLLEGGAVGVAGWALAFVAVALLVPSSAWSALVPLVVAVVVANGWDTTLFDRWSFYVVVVTFGLATVETASRKDLAPSRVNREARARGIVREEEP